MEIENYERIVYNNVFTTITKDQDFSLIVI